jgi:hypothetical protein
MSDPRVARHVAFALLLGLMVPAAAWCEDKEKPKKVGSGQLLKVDAEKGVLTAELKQGEKTTLTAADDITVVFPRDESRKKEQRFDPTEEKDMTKRLKAAFPDGNGGRRAYDFYVVTRDGKEVCSLVRKVGVDK